MKKYLITSFAMLLCITMLAACIKREKTPPLSSPSPTVKVVEPTPEPVPTVADYFPFLANTVYEYEGNGVVAAATNTVYNGYIEGTRVQRRTSAVNLAGVNVHTTELVDVSDGKVTLIFGDAAYYFYDNISQSKPSFSYVILQEPLVVGQKWTADENTESEITSVDTLISTPAGEFKALEVTNTVSNGSTEKYYYAKGVGLVKSICETSAGEVISTLSNLRRDVGIQVPVTFFSPNLTSNEVEKAERTFGMQTNQDFIQQFEKEMKIVPSNDYAPLLTENTRINGIEIEWSEDALATVDLSVDYLKEINVGDGIQNTILQSIANTIGRFYGVQRVSITIDGKPFKNGSISFAEDEFLTVEKPAKAGE